MKGRLEKIIPPALSLAGLMFSLGISQRVDAQVTTSGASLNTARYWHTATLLSNGKLLVTGGYNGGTLNSAEFYDPATGTWTATGSLNTARDTFTATTLPNGQVLVVGGEEGGVNLAGVESYNPATGVWTTNAPLSTARELHSATLLPNGRVLVAGGYNGAILSSAVLYDPASGLWTNTGSLNTGRYQHTATLLPGGKVLVAGGYGANGTPLASAELYDPASGAWATVSPLHVARAIHTATLLPGGQVLVTGGLGVSAVLAASELYDPAGNTWTTVASLNTARRYHTATLLPNGTVLVAAGYNDNSGAVGTLEVYSNQTWNTVGSLSNARWAHTTTLLANGQVLVTGGFFGDFFGVALASVEIYYYPSGTWTTTNSMAAARYQHTATLLANGKVLVAGGTSTDHLSPVASAELYDPASGTWSGAGSLNPPRQYHTATLLQNGKVLVAGGVSTNYAVNLLSTELYDPASGTWTNTGPLNNGREDHTATLLPNGKVLVAGGEVGGGVAIATAELYDPATGTWANTGPLNYPRSGHTATLLPNGKVLVAGGVDLATDGGGGIPLDELYDPGTGIWTTNKNWYEYGLAFHTATLLPNGKVLIAGGINPEVEVDNMALLYDPASDTWADTGSMNDYREGHTATLLPNGKVLAAGGENYNVYASDTLIPDSSAELYDPATQVWTYTSPLNNGCYGQTATLLPGGEVLAAGGEDAYTYSIDSGAELFDPGLSFEASWQARIAMVNSPLFLGTNLVLTGSQFRGVSEGSGGNNFQDSSSAYPLVQLRRLDNEQTVFLSPTNWSTNSYTSMPVTNFPVGYAMATVFANGVPSPSAILDVAYPTATVALSNLVQYFDLTAKSVSVTTVPPGLSVTVTYNSAASAPTNVGNYTVVALVNSTLYQGGATNTLQIELLRNFGVDASHYQNSNGVPQTNWARIYAEGQRFAYVKASEGLTGPDDPTMAANVANARQAGLLVGVYHFAHPENRPTTNGAVMEADHLLSYAGAAIGPGMLRPALDIETGAGTLSASEMTDWVLAFSQELVNNQGAGAAPIVYCTAGYAATNFDSRLAGHALWVEASGGDLLTGGPSSTGIFTNWAFWQYNLSGSAGGISPIDLDVCHDDLDPLSSYIVPTLPGSFGVKSVSADDGGFHISLTNVAGLHFTVLTTTNVATPPTHWTILGAATEIAAGQYQFTDPPATNLPERFYWIRWP